VESLRRPEKNEVVVGTLLGSKDGSQVDIQTCFSVPLSIEDGTLVIDKDYLAKMLKFHKKVNPKEGLIGFYFSSHEITSHVTQLFTYYSELMKDKKNKPVLKQPLLMLVDPTMQNDRMSIKVLSLENTRPLAVFSEVPFSFQVKDFERSGLDVVFFGQDHYDTMAILQ
jgi:translation initiation factor 3 subunit F